MSRALVLAGFFAVSVFQSLTAVAQDYTNTRSFTAFESQQFRPLAMSPDGNRLFVVNTPDGRLEIFDVTDDGIFPLSSVSVGLEPVAVAARDNSEVWVVNHLSDSVSIVDVSGVDPRVSRTLLVGDEPRDIVFAGGANSKAFITTAHRGQNSPYTDPDNPAEATTPGIGRADVWVFDASDQGSSLGGAPINVLSLFGDSPGALAVTPDGNTVYASVFKSGNQTTVIGEHIVCDGGAGAEPCVPGPGEETAPGGLPAPNEDSNSVTGPETGLIIKYDGSVWRDELGRDWNDMVRFDLPDLDVFAIDAAPTVPVPTASYPSVGTVLFGMAVNPDNGKLYVTNTEALNEKRFIGPQPQGSSVSTLLGDFVRSRVTVIEPGTGAVSPRHLNKHIDYGVSPAPTSVRDASLAMPTAMVVTADGSTVYVAAMGSAKVGVFDAAQLENDSFTPNAADQIQLTGGGPTGLLLDEGRGRLYVFTRFDNTVAVIDTVTGAEEQRASLFNPEPASITDGRHLLYDAKNASSNGESSCASCHIAADKDELAWDLGMPDGVTVVNPNEFKHTPAETPVFHPLKGPMLTQTLRGIETHGPLHFRGDVTAADEPGGDYQDAVTAFQEFNGAFIGLLGRESMISTEDMAALSDFVMQLTPPPNPVRNLDMSWTPKQFSGRALFFSDPQACGHCHRVNFNVGWYGTFGKSGRVGTQDFKISQLRNLYERIGMFGIADGYMIYPGDNQHTGDQVRGYGYLHDGSQDTLFRYNLLVDLVFPGGDDDRRDVEQFQLAFPTNLTPIVGQQVTIGPNSGTAIHDRADLLIARSLAGDADLVVRAIVAGDERGWFMTDVDTFMSDRTAEPTLTESQLRALANQSGQELTYTATPPGSGIRMGVDRDLDGIWDGDDNCPAAANPLQEDADFNSIGDACETDADNDGMIDSWELIYGLDPMDPTDAAAHSDEDGLTNLEEHDYKTNPNVADTDGDWIKDHFEVKVLKTNPNTNDTDGDSMVDFWEAINYVGPTNPNSGSGNPDGDAYTNLEEFQNGTLPRRFDP